MGAHQPIAVLESESMVEPEERIARSSGLTLALVVACGLCVLALSIYGASVLPYYRQLRALTAPGITSPIALRSGLSELGLSSSTYALIVVILELTLVLGFTVFAFIIALRQFGGTGVRQSHSYFAIYLAAALIIFATTFSRASASFVLLHPVMKPLVDGMSGLGFSVFFIGFYLFPNGRFVPSWASLFVPLWLLEEFKQYFISPSFLDRPVFVLFLFLVGTCLYAQIYRYRRVSPPVERQQTKWVVVGFSAAVIGFLGYGFTGDLMLTGRALVFHELVIGSMMMLCFLGLPLTIVFAMARYRLWDVDFVINRTVLYSALTLSVVALYVLIVESFALFTRNRTGFLVSLCATGLVAVLFQPLRARLQSIINHLMYGERDEPYTVLMRLGQRMEAATVPDQLLAVVVDTVVSALKFPYAAIALRSVDAPETLAAEAGVRHTPLHVLPLTYQGELVGEFSVGLRAHGERLSPADDRVLAYLANEAGAVAYLVRLSRREHQLLTDLQTWRERWVTISEEERRRLRRDLHDGLGPQLAGFTLRIDAARNLLHSSPAAADDVLVDLSLRAQEAVSDIRRLVYGLRPPVLDDVGLVAALRQQADQIGRVSRNGGGAPLITFEIPAALPSLPAAVEAAAYRIVQEAMTNVIRHAEANWCSVRIAIDDSEGALSLEVRDNGQGIPKLITAGVGLASMRDRTEELGGQFRIQSNSPNGTTVSVRIPFQRPDLEDSLIVGRENQVK